MMPNNASPFATEAVKRLRWKSRRGLLELDLLLADFWQQHGEQLSKSEEQLLTQWLAMDDDDLWALLQAPPIDDECGGWSKQLAAKIHPRHASKITNR
ncbi:MAG: succinate dehydrogenase assembly factor 2 [Proteobacteria bacterium]|nr:succinate dehydrogenase assembly factor 2 [Pseudomonadota bacterium]MCH9758405.1 succinate dehydrogenase assembly factor 2 [Pseudomonadota bacterium]